jgi:hypothetical protein
MKLESRIEHAAALSWMSWVMHEYGQKMPEPVGAFFNHVASTVDDYERRHYGPYVDQPCPDCAHLHEGPVISSPYEGTPDGHACLKCACKVRT